VNKKDTDKITAAEIDDGTPDKWFKLIETYLQEVKNNGK